MRRHPRGSGLSGRRWSEGVRDFAVLVVALAVIAGALWAARALCRANPGCPWTILY